MTKTTDHITQLLSEAPDVPASPELRQQIMATAILDVAPSVPASPNLKQSILAGVVNQEATTNVVQFKPRPTRTWFNPTALAGSVMAASLILGIWTGSSGVADALLAAPFELAGLNLTDTSDDVSFYNVIDGLTSPESL